VRSLIVRLFDCSIVRVYLLPLSIAIAAVLAIYSRVIPLAFFFDDPIDLTRAESRSYWALLSSSEGYQYYRPIPFVIWKLLRGVQGHFDHTTLHLIPLIAHAVSGWLIYLLLRRLGTGYWALVPMVLFLTAPFHYQVLPIIGPTAHVLAGMFLLASLNLYAVARLHDDSGQARYLHAGALMMSILALWSHESGVVVAPLIVGLEAVVMLRQSDRRPSLWPLAHIAAAGAFFLVWSTIDKLPSTEQTNLAEAGPKALFFLQGFTYPVSAQLIWLEDHLGVSVGILRAGIAAIMLGLLAYWFAMKRTENRWIVVLPLAGLAIGTVAALPSMLRLSWGYVENGPRLLYLVMIGAALFWGLLPSLDFGNRHATLVWRIASTALLFSVVVQSWRFVNVRLDMFESGSATIGSIVRLGEQYRGQRIVVANMPSWFALGGYEYRYGHFGIQVVPFYLGLDGVVYVNSSQMAHADVQSVSWQPDVAGGPFSFGPHGVDTTPEQMDSLLREGYRLVTVTPTSDHYTVREVGRLTPDAATQLLTSPGSIDGNTWLDSIRAARTKANPELLTVFVTWNVVGALDENAETVIEVRDDANHLIYQHVGYALGGMSAPRLWQAGDKIADSVAFPVPNDGAYTVHVGMQRIGTGERLPAYLPDGSAAVDNMLPVGTVHVVEGRISVDSR